MYADGSRRQRGGTFTHPFHAQPTARSADTENSPSGAGSVDHRRRPPSQPVQRLIIRCAASEYRAPCTVIWEAAPSMSRRSSSVSSTAAAADVLLQAMQLRRPRDRHDPRLLGQEPGECDLGGRRVLPSGDAAEQFDQRLVRLPGLRREAGNGVAEVGAVEGGALVDLAGEVALAQRAERDEADAEFFERRE